MHHRMDTGEQQRVDHSGRHRVRTQPRRGLRPRQHGVVRQDAVKDRLGADLPMDVENMAHTERVDLLHFEL